MLSDLVEDMAKLCYYPYNSCQYVWKKIVLLSPWFCLVMTYNMYVHILIAWWAEQLTPLASPNNL